MRKGYLLKSLHNGTVLISCGSIRRHLEGLPMLTDGIAVRMVDVSKKRGEAWALRRLTLSIPAGAISLVSGHNGSGKSTLLSLMAGQTSPTLGTLDVLTLDGKNEREAIRARCGFIGHAHELYEDLTAHENLTLFAALCVSRNGPSIADALAQMALSQVAHQSVRTFSAGMKRRVALAKVIMKEPDLLILDEPFGELDARFIALTEALIRTYKQRGRTVIFTTHWLEHGRALCDYEFQLEAGQLSASSTLNHKAVNT